MTDFAALLDRFVAAAGSGNGNRLAALFTENGVYVDGFYGEFRGRQAIAEMLEQHFFGAASDFRWDMHDPVCDGRVGYARYTFSYVSTLPESAGRPVLFEGIACFELTDELIARYSEVFDRGIAMAQLDFPAERMKKSLLRAANDLRTRVEAKGQH